MSISSRILKAKDATLNLSKELGDVADGVALLESELSELRSDSGTFASFARNVVSFVTGRKAGVAETIRERDRLKDKLAAERRKVKRLTVENEKLNRKSSRGGFLNSSLKLLLGKRVSERDDLLKKVEELRSNQEEAHRLNVAQGKKSVALKRILNELIGSVEDIRDIAATKGGEIEEMADSIMTKLVSISNQISPLEKGVKDLYVRDVLSAIEDEIERKRGDDKGLVSDLAVLTYENKELEKENARLRDSNQVLRQDLSTLTDEYNMLRKEVDEIVRDLRS